MSLLTGKLRSGEDTVTSSADTNRFATVKETGNRFKGIKADESGNNKRKTYTYSEMQKFFRGYLGYKKADKISFFPDKDWNGHPTGWVRFWDNDKRVKITMHQDLANHIAQDLSQGVDTDNLGLQPGEQGDKRIAKNSGEAYIFFRVVRYGGTSALDM